MEKTAYRVLLTDADRFPVSPAEMRFLTEIGAELIEVPYGISEEQLAETCKEIDAVLVFGAKMTRKVIEGMTRCQIMARCGIGYDNIDVQSAFEKAISVTYVPDYCVEEVSDHTLALLFDCLRKISLGNDRVKKGFWDSYEKMGMMRRVSGQTIGLLGFGRIAQALARKLQGFQNVNLIAHDPYSPPDFMKEKGVRAASFEELLSTSDIILLLLPLTAETKHIINQEAIGKMKPGVILLNTSRGGLIDEQALIQALTAGHIGAVGLDVLESEPPEHDNPLLQFPQVTITPHSAAFSEEALGEVKTRAIQEVCRKLQGLEPLMPVPVR